MARFPYQYININGIPTIEARKVTVTDTAVDFQFNPDFDGTPFRGLLLVYLPDAIPSGTTTTLPITFTMAGNTQTLTFAGSDPVTVADFGAIGVHIVYYDRFTSILQFIG